MFRSRHHQIMRGVAIVAVLMQSGVAAFAQTPSGVTGASDPRDRCSARAAEKAEAAPAHVLSIADGASVGMSVAAVDDLNNSKPEILGSSHSSKYDAANDRCYIRLYEHKRSGEFETESHRVFDARTGDLLAFARRVNGKEAGYVFGAHKGPWVPPANCGSCASGVGWDAAIAYMDETMADRRK